MQPAGVSKSLTRSARCGTPLPYRPEFSARLTSPRVATSGEYLLRLSMTPSSQALESPENPERFTPSSEPRSA